MTCWHSTPSTSLRKNRNLTSECVGGPRPTWRLSLAAKGKQLAETRSLLMNLRSQFPSPLARVSFWWAADVCFYRSRFIRDVRTTLRDSDRVLTFSTPFNGSLRFSTCSPRKGVASESRFGSASFFNACGRILSTTADWQRIAVQPM